MSTRIIIQNATILTLDDSNTFYYPGAVEILNDKIVGVYQWPNVKTGASEHCPDEKIIIIDATDKLVMPGLVDLHFHTSVAKVSFASGDTHFHSLIINRATRTIFLYGSISIESGIPQSEHLHRKMHAQQLSIPTSRR